jgi:hypothetical protein
MSARTVIEEAMPGLTDERQEELGLLAQQALVGLNPGESVDVPVESPAEATYVSHVTQGTCLPVYLDGRVRLTRHREHSADVSMWDRPDDPNVEKPGDFGTFNPSQSLRSRTPAPLRAPRDNSPEHLDAWRQDRVRSVTGDYFPAGSPDWLHAAPRGGWPGRRSVK